MTAPELLEEMVERAARGVWRVWPPNEPLHDDVRDVLAAAGVPELIAERDRLQERLQEAAKLLSEAHNYLPEHFGIERNVAHFLTNHEAAADSCELIAERDRLQERLRGAVKLLQEINDMLHNQRECVDGFLAPDV